MRWQRLAAYGPTAAYVGAAALLVFFPFVPLGHLFWAPGSSLSAAMAAVNDLSLWLWIAAFAVVALDLERLLEPPSTASRWRLARWAILVPLVMPVVLVLGQVLTSGLLLVIAFFLIFVGVGIGLVVHNDEARRAGLLHGALPWLGVVTGVGYILSGIGLGAALFELEILFIAGVDLLLVVQILYIGWAIWIGARLSKSRAGTPA